MGNIFSTNRSSLTIWPLIASAFICSSALANELYREALRPQFHFTSAKGYINDPNGLVYVDGKYHLFFQAGPINAKRWGHAISTDLIHWNQLNDAISPANGHPAFSGCAVIDHDNTSGLQTGEAPPLVAVFTSWGEGQCLAFSNDQGMSWKRYEGNPVLKLRHDAKRSFPLSARDPHVMWYEQQQRWVMVLYENLNAQKLRGVSAHEQGGFSIFTSPDLKQWTRQSHLSGFYVCPDVFELPIQGEKSKAWVAMDWAKYTTGTFDGTRFSPHGEALPLDYGSKDTLSANQTWKHLSDGRVIQICWIRGGKYPGMPFDQQHSFPTSLSLRRVAGRLRLCKQPICEISQLYGKREGLKQAALTEGQIEELGVGSHSYDLQ
ncbi:MAG: glycoside hydrolase family 32 protein, partial [Lacipirellulaceae bacterium]